MIFHLARTECQKPCYMREITDILKAYQEAVKSNKKAALATVVNVEGSSYRRPGARMLITEDGQLTGAISGGCLEGDALRKALSAMHQQENKLVTYDTTDEDDASIGVQLGCNGIVHILFEPIIAASEMNPIKLLMELQGKRENAVVMVLYSLRGKKQLGTHMLLRKNHPPIVVKQVANEQLLETAHTVLENKTSSSTTFTIQGEEVQALVELISPPIALMIAGAGNDAQPLAQIANLLGWQVTIADGRQTHATAQRFNNASKILVSRPAQLLPQLQIDEKTAFVLMTHNYNYDLGLLKRLLETQAPYIGILGPKSKLIRMLDELGMNTEENHRRIHGPVGLDIAAETADEIAISIIAEIKAVLSGAVGGQLKEKKQPIHSREVCSQ